MVTANSANTVVTEDELRPSDVLLGRGKTFHFRQGNVEYRRAVKIRSRDYQLRQSQERDTLAMDVIKDIREKGGRFLHLKKQQGGGNGAHCWVQCPDAMVWTKVKQALRDSGKPSQSLSVKEISRRQDKSVERKSSDPQVCSLMRKQVSIPPSSNTVASPTVAHHEQCTIRDLLLRTPYLHPAGLGRNVSGIGLSPVASLADRLKAPRIAAVPVNPLLFALMQSHRRPTIHPLLLSSSQVMLAPTNREPPVLHSQRYLELLRNYLQPEQPMLNSEVVDLVRKLQGSS